MSLLLWGSALLAVGALSWLHLRPTGGRGARAVPSLQHLRGQSPPRRRTLPLEEPLAWALRTASLLLAVAGVWLSRSGCAADARPVLVVDPTASTKALEAARTRVDAATVLGFDGEQPLALGEDRGQAEAALRACSDTRAACLLGAAKHSGRPVVLLGAFSAAEWRLALARSAQPFSFLRTEARSPSPEAPAAPRPPLARVRPEGTSRAARIWAAALGAAAGEAESKGPSRGDTVPPQVDVLSVSPPSSGDGGAALRVFAAEAPSVARPGAPAVEVRATAGLLLPDPLDLAAGSAGLGLKASLAIVPDARFSGVLPLAALSKGSGAELALAATPEELGEWAHQGSLLPLARALLAAGLPGPTEVETAPAGGALAWTDVDGRPAPVGLVDVAPESYRRSDGRVLLHLARARVPGEDALDDGALGRLGGRPWARAASRRPFAGMLFSLALVLWLVAVFLTRAVRRAWLPAAAVALALALLVADVRWPSEATAAWAAILAVPPGPDARALSALARASGVRPSDASNGGRASCASFGDVQPCSLLGTVGLAAAPMPGTDVLLFDGARPRVDILSVEAPREVPLGAAAEIWTTVRVRRAAGERLTVSVRSTSAAPTSAELLVDGPDAVTTVRLSVTPLSVGVSFLAVDGKVAGEPQAEDGRLLALAARAQRETRLVLAAAPGWEARAAAHALEGGDAQVEALSLLGTRATVAEGRPAQPPRELLHQAGALQGVGLVAVVGFGPKDLDASAAAALRHFVEGGGALLVLDAPGAAAALGIEVPPLAGAAPLEPLVGQLAALGPMTFRGYAPPASFQLPAGATVLGRLRPQKSATALPWVVGRGFGKGRVVVLTAPDAWRVSSPGEGNDAYQQLLASLVGWLEAPRASLGGVALSEDWATLRLQDAASTRMVPLPAPATVGELSVDTLDVSLINHSPRAALRAAASGRHHPFLELEGPEALTAAWQRLPPPPRWRTQVRARASDTVFAALAALVVLESLRRRRYGGSGGKGSFASTWASPGETGGTTSGVGESHRASETPAARAAALNAAPSVEA